MNSKEERARDWGRARRDQRIECGEHVRRITPNYMGRKLCVLSLEWMLQYLQKLHCNGEWYEIAAIHGDQHAVAGRKRKPAEADGKPARLDGQRRQRPAGGRGTAAFGIRVCGFPRFGGGTASVHPRQFARDLGSSAPRQDLQRRYHCRCGASQMAGGKSSDGRELREGFSRGDRRSTRRK